ncbi:MAG: DNA-processing protein DprA [Acidimicrobiia bacterium]
MNASEIVIAALVHTPGMTPTRLRALLQRWPDPHVAYERVRARRADTALGTPPNIDALAQLLTQRSTRVLLETDAAFPIPDPIPDRPLALFCEGGATDAFAQPRVAIVGTRAATPAGLADAHTLGAWCAQQHITTVSGMALGIDGAAHTGTLDAQGLSIGVLATGLDVTYPRRHIDLYARMRSHGLLISESPLGTRPHAGRFPVRNRIIAALADVVVVVEATASGGARITADLALEYGRPVFAIPGARRNPSAAGCNALLADGAHPLLDPTDLLPSLGGPLRQPEGWDVRATAALSASARAVLRACDGEPTTSDALGVHTELDAAALALALDELAAAGHIARTRGLIHPLTDLRADTPA